MNDRDYAYIPNWIFDDGLLARMSSPDSMLVVVIAGCTHKWAWSREISANDFCRMTGLARSSVYRSIRSLKDFGIIEQDGQRFRFLNPYGIKSRPGFVYAIRSESGAIKVGFSTKSPEARVRQMQTGTAEALELVGFVSGTHDDEQECHKILKDFGYHIRGEWFEDGEWSGVFATGGLAEGESVVDGVEAGIARMMASKSGGQT